MYVCRGFQSCQFTRRLFVLSPGGLGCRQWLIQTATALPLAGASTTKEARIIILIVMMIIIVVITIIVMSLLIMIVFLRPVCSGQHSIELPAVSCHPGRGTTQRTSVAWITTGTSSVPHRVIALTMPVGCLTSINSQLHRSLHQVFRKGRDWSGRLRRHSQIASCFESSDVFGS